mgnify:CR=1 FL=1
MKIKEIIVVEGKNDTAKIKLAVEADTIETNGSEISKETLNQIKIAHARRGVIVFTDPDFPGEKVRKTIQAHVPGVKHAFLLKDEAKAKSGKGLGIEHASVDAIRHALIHVREERQTDKEYIRWQTLVDLNFVGGGNARRRREQLGNILKIGYMNAKQLYKRLNAFQITPQELESALRKMKEVEKDD